MTSLPTGWAPPLASYGVVFGVSGIVVPESQEETATTKMTAAANLNREESVGRMNTSVG